MSFIRFDFLKSRKEASGKTVWGFVLAAILLGMWPFFYRTRAFFFVFKEINLLIGEFVEPTSFVVIVSTMTVLLFCTALFRFGRLRFRDAGLDLRYFSQAFIVTAVVWGISQLGVGIYEWLSGHAIELHSDWALERIGVQPARFIAYFLGVGLVEELIFRGFLAPQLYLKLIKRFAQNRKSALVLSLIMSQFLFGLVHLLSVIYSGTHRGAGLILWILLLTIFGIFYLLLYLRTENLLLVIGLHGLADCPMQLFQSSLSPFYFFGPLLVLMLLFWPLLPVRFRKAVNKGEEKAAAVPGQNVSSTE